MEDDFGAEEEAVGTTEMDPLELEQLLISLFKEADQDESGYLDFNEFAQLMATSDIGLSKKELEYLLAEADENSDGKVTYQEFVPLAVEVSLGLGILPFKSNGTSRSTSDAVNISGDGERIFSYLPKILKHPKNLKIQKK